MSGWEVYETEPSRLPDSPETAEEAYKSLVNGVLNHGCKIVTALALTDQPQTHTEIYRAALREAGYSDTEKSGSSFNIPAETVPRGYCEQSFLEIGLTAEEQVVDAQHPNLEGTPAFRRTGFGHHIQPILTYTAKATSEADHLDELNSVLGSTNTAGETRAPENTSEILYQIRQGADTYMDIVSRSGFEADSPVLRNLHRLSRYNVVEWLQPNKEGGTLYEVEQEVDPDDINVEPGYGGATEEVVKELDAGTAVSVDDITSTHDIARTTGFTVLSELVDQEILSPVPNLKLTPKGEEAVSILNDVAGAINRYMQHEDDIDQLSFDDALDRMPTYVESAWTEYTEEKHGFRRSYNQSLWDAARRASPAVETFSESERQQRAESIARSLQEKIGDPPTTEQVQKEWNRRFHSHPRSRTTISRYLEGGGAEKREKDGAGTVWIPE